MQVGTTIKSFRKSKGIKQKDLAKKAKVSPTYLSQIESNTKDPTLSTITAISKSLEIPLSVLLFISIKETDVPKEKREAFKMLFPSIKSFVENLFAK